MRFFREFRENESDRMSLALATTPLLRGVTDHSRETTFLEAKLQGVKD